MSKELDALERIRSHNYHEHNKKECLDIIETALKEHELMKDIRITARFDLAQVNKEHKALEIIKESIPIEGEDFFYDSEFDTYLFIGHKVSKEQFDLLKEVLL